MDRAIETARVISARQRETARDFRWGVITVLSGGRARVRLLEAASAGTEWYGIVNSFGLAVGDDVVLAPMGKTWIVLGRLQRSEPVAATVPGQLLSKGATPVLTILGASGSTATGSITGTDSAGIIQVTPNGTGITASAFVTLTFSTPRSGGGDYGVFLTPNSNAARGRLDLGPSGRTSTAFSLTVNTALTAGSNYQWLYWIVGYAN